MREKMFTFDEAIEFYLKKHSATDKLIKDFQKSTATNGQTFDKTIEKLYEAQKAKNEQYQQEQAKRKILAEKRYSFKK